MVTLVTLLSNSTVKWNDPTPPQCSVLISVCSVRIRYGHYGFAGHAESLNIFHQTWVWVWIHFHLLVCFSSNRSCFTQFKSIAFCGSNHCVDLGWPHINVKCRQRLVAHPHWAGSLPPTPHHCALSFAFGCKPGGAHTPRLGSAIRMCEHLVLYVQGIRMHAEVAIRPECTPRWFRK